MNADVKQVSPQSTESKQAGLRVKSTVKAGPSRNAGKDYRPPALQGFLGRIDARCTRTRTRLVPLARTRPLQSEASRVSRASLRDPPRRIFPAARCQLP